MKLHVPAGHSRTVLSDGTIVSANTDETVDVPDSEASTLLAAGYAYVGNASTGALPYASRPTIGLRAGMQYFDEHVGRLLTCTPGKTWVDGRGCAQTFKAGSRFDFPGNVLLTAAIGL